MDKKIQGHSNLVKRNNSIIDVDEAAYKAALKRKKNAELLNNLQQKNEELENKIEKLDDSLKIVQNMLSQILDVVKGK